MNADQRRYAPIGDPPPENPPLTFSLRTLFFITTCVAVFSAGVTVGKAELVPIYGGIIALGLFLTVWFAVKKKVTPAAWSLGPTLLGLFLTPVYSHSGAAGKRNSCANRLKQIGLALHNYHQVYGSFPPAYVTDSTGKPLYSWRVLILPYIEEKMLFMAFQHDEPWNGPTNAKLSHRYLPQYICPAGQPPEQFTDYVAVTGPNTAWPGAIGRKLGEFKAPGKTIMVIEVTSSGIQWAQPRDLPASPFADVLVAIWGDHKGATNHHFGVNALFADGHVEFLTDDTDPKTLAAMFDVNPPDETNAR